ncbi:protein CASC3-like isoform X3 [Aricia agestis]|uniref:protein CASC3-like isoform X3 n=1 Tax=Aricia agestis TaxID=91739 RepID=UPI001C20839B|nr:protein CASC3-like isoform X3 [Aricia agestis]
MTTVANRQEHDDSGEYSDASQDIEHNNSGNDAGQHESDYDSQGSDSEHSDGDPDKQEAERRVDDDEDRSNPQYIPKRGTFYEHDDRTAASGEESSNTTSETVSEKKEGPETPAERRRPPRKSETLNKWSHDKYNENEQMPKSRDELVAIYGYDIRNEDAPPHARRNRRYGYRHWRRGPNKYTRTWEDEEAYKRQAGAQPPKKPPSPADFPELGAANKPGRRMRAPRPRSKSQPTSNDSSENGSQLRRNASIKATKPNKPKPVNKPVKPMKDLNIPLENLTITTTVNNNSPGQPQRKVNSSIAQQKPVPTEQVKKKLTPSQTAPQNNAAQNKPQVPSQQKPQAPKSQQQPSQQPPAAGAESRGGSKRYSSLRQRPLAETYSPQQQPQQNSQQPQPQTQQQQHRFHANDYVAGTTPVTQHQGSPGPIHPQQMMHQQVHRNSVSQAPHGPSPPHQQLPQPPHNQPQLRLLEQQQIVSHPHHTLHNMPQQHSIGQIPPAQGYAPPAMMPAQYMQQGGNNAVFAGAPMYQPPAAYAPHQLYQHHNYAQAGGVTYYSCAEQEQPPRAQRRPTAAIPIVRPAAPQPPPANAERSANSSDKDIDRIVENMFVRKPYKSPNDGGESDASKDKQERSSQEPQSKESSQPNSLTSSSISTDSKLADRTEQSEEKADNKESEVVSTETITTDA